MKVYYRHKITKERELLFECLATRDISCLIDKYCIDGEVYEIETSNKLFLFMKYNEKNCKKAYVLLGNKIHNIKNTTMIRLLSYYIHR